MLEPVVLRHQAADEEIDGLSNSLVTIGEMQGFVDRRRVKVRDDRRGCFRPLGVKSLCEAREGHMLGLDRPGSQPRWWNVDQAAQPRGPGIEATNALRGPDDAKPDHLELTGAIHDTGGSLSTNASSPLTSPLS